MDPWTVKRVIVLGGGSAGFLAALALKSKLPDLPVLVIRSKEIGVIGVGEGSTLPLTRFLHGYIKVNARKFVETARPAWKLGLKFIWGPDKPFHYTFGQQLDAKHPALPLSHGFYCDREMANEDLHSALMSQDRVFPRAAAGGPEVHAKVAYHFENERFVAFLEAYATALGVATRDDTVAEVRRDERGVAGLVLASGATESADLYVDCSGFASLLLGKALGEPFVAYDRTLFCRRAVVGGWDRIAGDADDQVIRPYTTCETMDAGWAWQIEHENRVNRGYVYCPDFVSDEDAEREFRAKNPKVGSTRVVRFTAGRYRDAWVGNVVAVGNAAGFVEPLEASALGVICLRAQLLTNILAHCEREVRPSQVGLFNRENAANWDSIRDFLAVHYRFNTRLDTPFWRHCRAETDLGGAAPIVDHFRENGPANFWGAALFGPHEAFGLAGYLALLVGQRVPYRRARDMTDAERRTWATHQQKLKDAAARGLTVRETLAAIRSPKWKWAPHP